MKNPFNVGTTKQPLPYKQPFDNTGVGIAVNTVKGVPRELGRVATDIFHSITRNLAGAGMTLTGQQPLTPGESPFAQKVFKALYGGTEPVTNLQDRIVESERKINESPFAQKHGLTKYATPLAFGGVLGNVGLDLTGFGGVEKNLAKQLVKEVNPEIIVQLLKKTGLSENVAKEFAPKFAELKSVKEVEDGLNVLKHSHGTEAFMKSGADEAIEQTTKEEIPITAQAIKDKIPTVADDVLKNEPPVGIPGVKTAETELFPVSQEIQKLGGESLDNIIKKETLPVNKKVNIVDYLRTPENVLKKIGLENEAKIVRKHYDAYMKELPENISKITDWSKKVTAEGNKKIFQFLDGQAVELSKEEVKVAGEVKEWLADWAKRLNLPEDKQISGYITHIFEKDFIQKEFDPDIAKLIQDRIPGSVYDPFLEKRLGKLGYVEDTWRALDAYVKRATRKVNMDPALEALNKAGEKLDLESYNYVQRLASGINLRPTELENLVDNFVKQIPGVGYKLGQRPVANVTRTARQMVYRGTLGLNVGSALRNLTQGVNTYAELGEKYTAKGYWDLMRNGTKELKEVGVLADNFIQDRALSSTKKALEKFDKGLFSMFEVAEKINRGSAYYGAKARALAKGATEEEAIQEAKDLVRKTQFAFGSIDTPIALQSDVAKTIAQLQTFTLKQMEFLGGKVAKKEFAGLARYVGGSLLMVATIGKLFGMKPKDLLPWFRFDLPPTLGVAEPILHTVTGKDEYGSPMTAEKSVKEFGAAAIPYIPAGAQAKKTIQGIKAVSQGKDTTATGRTRYKIKKSGENYARAAIFGKSNLPEAQKYYKNKNKKKSTTTSNPFNQ